MTRQDTTTLTENQLRHFYIQKQLSMQQIADMQNVSLSTVTYWMKHFGIPRRKRNDALYVWHNPQGDPFSIKEIRNTEDAQLLGMGIGLYWGEGNKANKYSVRLGNTDPALLKIFIKFLVEICGIDTDRLRFGLQLFSDCDKAAALSFWCDSLTIKPSQFYKVTVTISGSIGTYRNKSEYGVVTIYYHNKKLRDLLVGMLPR